MLLTIFGYILAIFWLLALAATVWYATAFSVIWVIILAVIMLLITAPGIIYVILIDHKYKKPRVKNARRRFFKS